MCEDIAESPDLKRRLVDDKAPSIAGKGLECRDGAQRLAGRNAQGAKGAGPTNALISR